MGRRGRTASLCRPAVAAAAELRSVLCRPMFGILALMLGESTRLTLRGCLRLREWSGRGPTVAQPRGAAPATSNNQEICPDRTTIHSEMFDTSVARDWNGGHYRNLMPSHGALQNPFFSRHIQASLHYFRLSSSRKCLAVTGPWKHSEKRGATRRTRSLFSAP